jgi:eukaryotic translation initiation factor 2C
MPPRGQTRGTRGGGAGPPSRGAGPGRGASPARGGPPQGQAYRAPREDPYQLLAPILTHCTAAHVTTVGVRRPDYGSSGRPIDIQVNSFTAEVPDGTIYHYDGACAFLLQHESLFSELMPLIAMQSVRTEICHIGNALTRRALL